MKISNFVFLFLLNLTAWAGSDYGKETRWAEQIEDSLLDGEVVWLESNAHKFMTIFTEASVENPGNKVAVVLHGIGAHPDWPQVVQPVRTVLSENGWHTLSIQLPVLANDKKSDDYKPLFADANKRIAKAYKYLKKQNLNPEVIIAHSLGSAMAAYYLAKNPSTYKKFIAIGISDLAEEYLPKLGLSILDLYGSEDLESVVVRAPKRAKMLTNSRDFKQKKVVGADHFFIGREDKLLSEILNWLGNN